MLKKTMTVGSASKVRITAVPGDLRVTGWDRDEISAKTDGDMLDLVLGGDEATVTCDSDLILSIPRRLSLDIEAVSGDVDVRELPGGVTIREVEGDLSLRLVGAAIVGAVMGDLEARESGPLSMDDLHADLSVRGGKGDLAVKSIDGDVSLHDMQGNVKEWCLDWYGTYPSGTVTDPQGPTTGQDRVNRGGSWSHAGNWCRSAQRFHNNPASAQDLIGFRIVLAPTP